MNISSVILKVNPEYLDSIIQDIDGINGVEVAMSESGIIIATIEAIDSSEEISIFKQLQEIKGVFSVNVHCSYFEDETEKLLSAEEISRLIEESDSKDISYKGNPDFWIEK
ncbi:hypothetical protein BKH42_07095 [Helicobacter sp. 13S00482-2]|uniref:chaperone NapD n=1 Tax=Helicobacter sp. 13S00482-2 TaxID=1476200 RepID=UPI000BA77B53|nr:chaperone NapD [Helicobacter sp. 13S00482-2]PAF53211.1 hypothetical protein BKH42_07095 [Helicobacter sp. 13S00482-2]